MLRSKGQLSTFGFKSFIETGFHREGHLGLLQVSKTSACNNISRHKLLTIVAKFCNLDVFEFLDVL